MKKFVVALAIVGATLGLSVASFGQAAGPRGGAPGRPGGFGQGPRGGGGGMRRFAKINEEIYAKLNLNAGQKAKLKALDEKQMDKMKEIFQKSGGDREKMRTAMQGARKDYEKSLAGILSKDQLKKYVALRKEAFEKMRADRGRGPGGPGAPGAPGAPKPPAGKGKGGA